MLTEAFEQWVMLKSSDECIRVPKDAAIRSGLLKRMFNWDFKESRERIVLLPQFEPETLKQVSEFLIEDFAVNGIGSKRKRTCFCFPVSAERALQILQCANYLEIAPLVSLVLSMITHHIEQVESLEGLPPDCVDQLCQLASPTQLARLEDKALVDDADRMEVWWEQKAESSKLVVPNMLRGAWEDESNVIRERWRNLFESAQWHTRGNTWNIQHVTRVHVGDKVVVVPPSVTFMSISCAKSVYSSLSMAPHLTSLALKFETTSETKGLKLVLPEDVCRRLRHLEVTNCKLSKRTSPMPLLECFHFAHRKWPDSLSVPYLTDSKHLVHVAICDARLTAADLKGLNMTRLVRFRAPGNRFGALRMGGHLMPNGQCLSSLHFSDMLQHLDLSSCNIHDDAYFSNFCESLLNRCHQLSHLVLCDNKVRARGAAVILAHPSKSLKWLDLSRNLLGKDFATLVESLSGDGKSLPCLEHLDVSQNWIPPQSTRLFLDWIDKGWRKSLKMVNVCRQSHWSKEYTELRRETTRPRPWTINFDPIDLDTENEWINIPAAADDDLFF